MVTLDPWLKPVGGGGGVGNVWKLWKHFLKILNNLKLNISTQNSEKVGALDVSENNNE